jgi:hypothetical protein
MALTIVRPSRNLATAFVAALLSLAAVPAAPQIGCVPEAFSALAVNRADTPVLLSSSVDIQIRRWSSDAEKSRLARTLLDGGPRGLLAALHSSGSLGVLSTPYTFPYEIRMAWQEPLEGDARRILLVIDHPVTIWKEAMRLRDSRDTFTVIELRIPYDGDGEGKVAIGSNIHVNRSLDVIELDDYAGTPLRLVGVHSRWATTPQ